jgi:membrane-bound ClpP family serine protease
MEPILIWAFAGLIVAFVLLVAELFIPSGGILGICAALFAIGAVILLAVHDTTWGLVAALGLMVVAPVLVAFMLKVWPHTPIGRRIIGVPSDEEVERDRLEALAAQKQLASMIGKQGLALTDLRPVGVIDLDGQRTDALAETTYIKAGSRVRIVQADGSQIKVRAQ